MGRAIVRNPKVFLFDEPLSNLDAKLRVQMRIEIKKVHQKVRTTTVYVTHDQVEAMTLADRVVVMNHGRVVCAGAAGAASDYSTLPSTRCFPWAVPRIRSPTAVQQRSCEESPRRG
jgi:multiple sugar transport system ATP-binding protein